jgi:hypothetical protein
VTAPRNLEPASPSRAPGDIAAPAVPNPKSLSARSDAASGSGTSKGSVQFNSDGSQAAALAPSDLDGDGRVDTFAINGGKLIATLSSDGTQSVQLPATGSGASVLGVAALSDPSSNTVPALFVRLRNSGGSVTDTIVTLVSGRLTVVQRGSEPVQLTVDASHGYGCNQRNLALAGDATPYVIDSAQLVASPQLRAVLAPAGKVSGCTF